MRRKRQVGIIRGFDSVGRITIPSEFRERLNTEKVEIQLILNKQGEYIIEIKTARV